MSSNGIEQGLSDPVMRSCPGMVELGAHFEEVGQRLPAAAITVCTIGGRDFPNSVKIGVDRVGP